MADEFQAEVCGTGPNWWINSSKGMFGSSPCSSGILDLGSFGWPTDFLDIKTRCSPTHHHHHHDSNNSASSDGAGSVVIQDLHKPKHHQDSSATTDHHHWDRALIHGSPDQINNYSPIQQQEDQNSSMNYRPEIQDSSVTAGFPINSVSYGYSSTLLQTLFDPEPQGQQPPPLYAAANRAMNNYPPSTNYNQTSLNTIELPAAASLPKFSPLQKLQQPNNNNNMQFHPGAGQNFCNGSAPGFNDFRPSFFPSTQPQFLSSTFNSKASCNDEVVQGLGTVAKKTGSEPTFKRPRIETPSPLPTFKVRKEKLGDRITALQQLVSPFGKTDTASVLHEAIEYIKFLHDQVNMLSTPYKKSGSPIHRQQIISDKPRDQEGSKEDLKSRGLCLVPISSTFPVAAETTTDFWTPTFGGTFR